MKRWKIIYIVLFFALCLVPSLGMLLSSGESSSENRELAARPQLNTEDGWNENFLEDAGEYFQDHFGFRNELVTVNALIMGKGLGVSTADGVIVGTDDWLYYKDSLDDYKGVNQMSDRQLFDVAHTLAMMQNYTAQRGVNFVFTVAPNKNTLYGEKMPYYYKYYREDASNLRKIEEYLEKENVNYVNLYDVFSSRDEVLYRSRDSHWNEKGASLAADSLLTALGKVHDSYENREYVVEKTFEGDLEQMLYPLAITPEDSYVYQPQPEYSYVEEVENNFEPSIYTTSDGKTGSLVMYRDSFGNDLLPYMAEAYGQAYFSRGIPYYLSDLDLCSADTLVVERAQRFLPDMTDAAPVMDAPLVMAVRGEERRTVTPLGELQEEILGDYTKISGTLNSAELSVESKIYVTVNGTQTYEAFPISSDGEEGFVIYLKTELAGEQLTLEIQVTE